MKTRKEIISTNIKRILEQISEAAKRSHRSSKEISLLAVTKNVSIEDIRIVAGAGIKVVGENKVQEAKEKFLALGPALQWHFIGHLQTNKARVAAAIFDMIESIDSERVADALDLEARRLDRELQVLVEVNIGQEESKFGIAPDKTAALLQYVRQKKNLQVRGLMAMAPYVSEPELSRPFFHELARLFRELRPSSGANWDILSMGMTHDFEVAIEEGATQVRIGTGIFHHDPSPR